MDILSRANWVDLLVVIVILRTIYISFQDGLSHEIFPLFCSVLKLVAALFFYDKLGLAIYSKASIIPLSLLNMFSFLAIVLIIGFALKFLKVLLDAVIKVTWHPLIEKIGGMLAGILRGTIAASMVLIFLALVPLSYLQWSIKDRSLYGMFFLRVGPAIYSTVSGGRVDDERITQDIIAKKNIPAKDSNLVKSQPEWEKVFDTSKKRFGGVK